MTWFGRIAWAAAVLILLFSLSEFAEPDLGTGFGLLVVSVGMFLVLRRFKVKW